MKEDNLSIASAHSALSPNHTTDSRFLRLCDRWQQYYLDTPDSMSNKAALPIWKEFREWCRAEGYTPYEIQKAKLAREYYML